MKSGRSIISPRRGIGGHIGPRADILAVKVQKHLGGLQDVGLDRHRARVAEGGHEAVGLGPGCGLQRHSGRAQKAADLGHEILARNFGLGGLGLPFLVAGLGGDLGAEEEVFELDNAFAASSRPGSRRRGSSFYRHISTVAEILRIAEIDLRPDARLTQFGGHRLIIGHPVTVHDRDDNGAARVGLQCGPWREGRPAGGQPRWRHPSREPPGR